MGLQGSYDKTLPQRPHVPGGAVGRHGLCRVNRWAWGLPRPHSPSTGSEAPPITKSLKLATVLSSPATGLLLRLARLAAKPTYLKNHFLCHRHKPANTTPEYLTMTNKPKSGQTQNWPSFLKPSQRIQVPLRHGLRCQVPVTKDE